MYGTPHENEKKKTFWHLMHRLFPIQNQPWLVIGDFNEILESSEKCGGDIPAQWRINLCRDFLSGRLLRDLHFHSPDFTWFAMRLVLFTISNPADSSTKDWLRSPSDSP